MRRSCLLALAALALAGCAQPSPVSPMTQRNCQLVWANRGTNQGRYDVYILDMPADAWTSGTVSLDRSVKGKERVAIFFDELDLDSGTWVARAITTSGSVSVTLDGVDAGQAVSLTDAGGHTFFDLDATDRPGAEVGNGGAASFTGVWSDSSADTPTPGSGQVDLSIGGSAVTLGNGNPAAPIVYGECYDLLL